MLKVKLLLNSMFTGLPFFPDLVVIKIAPLPPRYPYNADAAAPFNTCMLSISSGLMLLNPSPISIPPHVPADPKFWLLKGTPSTTYSGMLLPVREAFPRMITREEPPVPVELPPTLTPATLPERALPRFGSRAIVKSSPPTCVVE